MREVIPITVILPAFALVIREEIEDETLLSVTVKCGADMGLNNVSNNSLIIAVCQPSLS